MKILYAIQGTGNGHICRARDIIPLLQKKGEVDILVSGIQSDVDLGFEVKYKLHGLSFIFGKRGGVDLAATYRKNKIKLLYREITGLPVEDYDLIINDFEPISAWACRLKRIKCVGLSHQSSILNEKAPRPETKHGLGKTIIRCYAPTDVQFGFHFISFDRNIFTPVIRREVREIQPSDQGYYVVYLPAYHDKLIVEILSAIAETRFLVFSKHASQTYTKQNISVFPVHDSAFTECLAGASGVLCGAGFETPAEALYLRKKLMVIPMKNQYEQQCNAATLKEMGVPVLKTLNDKYISHLKDWIDSSQRIPVEYQDNTSSVVDLVMETHAFWMREEVDGLPSRKLNSGIIPVIDLCKQIQSFL